MDFWSKCSRINCPDNKRRIVKRRGDRKSPGKIRRYRVQTTAIYRRENNTRMTHLIWNTKPNSIWNRKRKIHRIFFEVLLNQTEIRLYLPFPDGFGTRKGIQFGKNNTRHISFHIYTFDIYGIIPKLERTTHACTFVHRLIRNAKRNSV